MVVISENPSCSGVIVLTLFGTKERERMNVVILLSQIGNWRSRRLRIKAKVTFYNPLNPSQGRFLFGFWNSLLVA